MFEDKYSRSVVQFLCCSAGSIIPGVLLFRGSLFQPDWNIFQFLASGALVGLFVASRNFLPLRQSGLVAAGIYFLILLVKKAEDPDLRIFYAVFVGGIYLATTGALLSDRVFPRMVFGKFIVWAALFGLLYLIAAPLLSWAMSRPLNVGDALHNARMGAMLGGATGFGYEIAVLAGAGRLDEEKAPRGDLES